MLDLTSLATGEWAPEAPEPPGPRLARWRLERGVPLPERSALRGVIEDLGSLGTSLVELSVDELDAERRVFPLAVDLATFGIAVAAVADQPRVSVKTARLLQGTGVAAVGLSEPSEACETLAAFGVPVELRLRLGRPLEAVVEEGLERGVGRVVIAYRPLPPAELRRAVDEAFGLAWELGRRSHSCRILLDGNPCDGPYVLLRLAAAGARWAVEAALWLAATRQAWDGSGMDEVAIGPSGEVGGAPGERWGNLGTARLAELWARSAEPRRLETRRLPGPCAGCRWPSVCGGRRPVGPQSLCYLDPAEIAEGLPGAPPVPSEAFPRC